MNGLITTRTAVDPEEVRAALAAYRVRGVVDRTTRPQAETYEVANPVARVALYDFGVKERMIQALVQRGCQVTVFPARTPAEVILRGGFDGVMLSNGPGDPQDCPEIIAQLRLLYDAGVRIFAVCLGHQLLALATGAPDREDEIRPPGRPTIPCGIWPPAGSTSPRQNHGYMVCAGSVDPAVAAVSHVNANDGTVRGPALLQRPRLHGAVPPGGRARPRRHRISFRPVHHADGRLPPMPKSNPNIRKVLVLGSGPIVIGQAAEFDYAGTQACRVLKEEGVEVVLVNSNPATIMTDSDIADHVYIEPLNMAIRHADHREGAARTACCPPSADRPA